MDDSDSKYKLCLLYVLIAAFTQSCFLINPTDEGKVKKDVLGYLESAYKEKFTITEIKWAGNEGNGWPDAHIVTCKPLNNTDLEFRVDVFYKSNDSFEIQRDEYLHTLLEYKACIEFEKFFKKFEFGHKLSLSLVSLNQIPLSKDIIEKDFEKLISSKVYSLHIKMLAFKSLKNNRDFYKDILFNFLKTYSRFRMINWDISFFNEEMYTGKGQQELKEVSSSPDSPYSHNIEYIWYVYFSENVLANSDSFAMDQLESLINEVDLKKKQEF